MSVAPTFPGIYVQEIPLSSHAITPAPTSIAAFVGYTHPYQTKVFNAAVQVFSFSDYEAAFGGLYTSGLLDANVARAVFQFFLNGGSMAWVVGLQPKAFGASGSTGSGTPFGKDTGQVQFQATIAATAANTGMIFTAQEPCDVVGMTVSVTNLRASTSGGALDTFDIVITYGSRNETYRGISLASGSAKDPSTINAASRLVTVAAQTAGYGTALAANASATFTITNGPTTILSTFAASDFTDVFADNSSLDKVETLNLLLVPGISDNLIVSETLAFAERKRAFAILDPPMNAVADNLSGSGAATIDSYVTAFPKSQNGALYFPYLLSSDPITDHTISVPPSGYVAGIFARTDANRGVWKAPAGLETSVLNTAGPVPTGLMNDQRQGALNILAVNCLRSFNSIGTVVFGSRTLVGADANTSFPQSKYVPVRRMTLFIEQTLVANLKWVVFEPNDEPLWLAIRASIEAFLLSLFNQGALQGSRPSQAFQVKCDSTTTTPQDQQNGIVNIVVAFAPLKPAEFVVIKIAQLAGQTA